MRAHVTSVLWIGLVLATVDVGVAQDRNDRRRQFFEGVLRTLVESQVDRQPDHDHRPPNRAPRDPQLTASRQTLQRFSDETARLLASLRREELTNPSYRSLLGDVVRIKANADVMLRPGVGINVEQFSDRYLEIDRQWRLVSHRLTQIPGVSRTFLAHVEKLNVYDRQICELLDLSPQFDRRELTRHVGEMQGSLRTLIDDLNYVPTRRPTVILEGQKLQASVAHLSQTIARNQPHQVVVAEYQGVYARWRALANQFRSIGDQYITRRLRSIEASHEAIHELLWIPKSIDRGEVLALIKTLQRDVNNLYRGVTLDHLLEHPHAQETVASAQTVTKLTGSLAASLAGRTSLDELVWDFRTLEVEWQTVSALFGSWQETDIDQRLAVVQRTVEVLSHTLGQDLAIDPHEGISLAAAIHNTAEALAAQAERIVNLSGQYPANFRQTVVAATKAFQEAAHHLHESIAKHEPNSHLKRDTLDLAKSWAAVKTSVEGFSAQHYAMLNQTAGSLDPQIAKMQILYAY